MKKAKQEEADNKTKAGTAWSHSYLNQKPWHPLSYPNQRRKWIAEQTQAEKDRKAEEVAREYAQEQEFFRQSALLSKKEQEKASAMQALSFMYMRPPGYNAESARAAELADEKRKEGVYDVPEPPPEDRPEEPRPKRRVLDIYGRPVPTEEEFPALKNAPRLETGTVARAKPFAVEIRNVKCARCGTFGHQSGDRECTMKDIIMPNEQERLKRDDPLTAMMAVASEGNKWELKNPLGAMSPPRGGFTRDDPNQQILAGDVDDEYGGFLANGDQFANILASTFLKKHKPKKDKKKRKKRKSESSSSESSSSSDDEDDGHTRKRRREDDRRNDGRSRRNHGDGRRDDGNSRRKVPEDDAGNADIPDEDVYKERRRHRVRHKDDEDEGFRASRHHRDDEDDRHRDDDDQGFRASRHHRDDEDGRRYCDNKKSKSEHYREKHKERSKSRERKSLKE